jgi:hypothetical protein
MRLAHSDSLAPDSCLLFSNRGQLDAETKGPAPGLSDKTQKLQVEIRDGLTTLAEARIAVWSGTAALYSPPVYTQPGLGFESSTHVLS